MAQSPEVSELLLELSDLTLAIGRRIKSPKNDPDDLKVLCDALEHVQEALSTTANYVVASYNRE